MKKNIAFILTGILLGIVCAGAEHLHSKPVQSSVAEIPAPVSEVKLVEVQVREWSWSDIENSDYSKLASNLQMVGCPERTVHDILLARINRKYAQLTLVNPLLKYWETPEDKKKRNNEIAGLWKEKQDLLQTLGLPNEKDRKKPVKAPDPFSPEKMQQISKITRQYPQTALPMSPTADEYNQSFNNRKARLDYLAQVLTPDELTQYRLTMDSNVGTVRTLLKVIDATPQEVNNCAFTFDFAPAAITDGTFSPEAEQSLKAGLGDQRYAELLAALSPENSKFNSFVMMPDVTSEQISQLQQLRQQHLDDAAFQNALNQILPPPVTRRYLIMVGNH